MKKLLDGKLWEYKDGQLHTWGGRDNKHIGYIGFEIDYDPLSLKGKIKFEGVNCPSLSTEIETSKGMEEIERVLDEYYGWAKALHENIHHREFMRIAEITNAATNRVIQNYINVNGGFYYGQS